MHEVMFDTAQIWQTPQGDWLALKVDKNHLQIARRFADSMTEGKQFVAMLKQYRQKRSLDSNAYFWLLADKVAEKIGISPEEVYRRLIPEIAGNREVICARENAADKLREGWERNGIGWLTDSFKSKIEGCVNVVLYYGSSTYDTKQMSRLIDLIVQEAKQLGIETMTPQELAALKDRWNDAQTD